MIIVTTLSGTGDDASVTNVNSRLGNVVTNLFHDRYRSARQ